MFLIYLFAASLAVTAFLVSSATLRLSLLALTLSAIILVVFGLILARAPVGAQDE